MSLTQKSGKKGCYAEVSLLLVAKAIVYTAVRALPCNTVAGHPPEIFLETFLTDVKSAPAWPVECSFHPAAMTAFLFCPQSFFSV